MFGNPSKSRLIPSSRRRVRLRVDRLEDRALLSTLTVTSPADSGPGTLRDRFAAAVSGDTINFAPSLVGQTITLTTGPVVDAGKSLTLAGPGASKLTISGNDSSRVLVFTTGDDPGASASIDVSISGLTLAHGKNASSGGALFTFGANVTLKDSVIRDSHSDFAGGGFDARAPFSPSGVPANSVAIVNTEFVNNSAGFLGGAYEGFGVTASISGSLFRGNSAPNLAGGVVVGGASLSVADSTFLDNVGGGIGHFAGFAPGSDRLDVSNSTFTGNTKASGFGGAIYDTGGTTTITGSTFTDNVSSDPYFSQGGAVAIIGGGDASVDRSTFVGNRADNPNGQLARGGGLFIEDTATARVTNSTFRNNIARGSQASGGGASRSFAFGSFFQPPQTVFSNDTFVDNSAISTASAFGGGTAVGGGLNLGAIQGSASVADSTFVGNEAVGGNSTTTQGGFARAGALAASGGFYFGPQLTLTVSGSNFAGNSARAGTGLAGGFGEGGAVYLGGFGATSFTGGSFVGNSAVGGNSTQPGLFGNLALGGAIRVLYGAAPSVVGTSFVGNSARGGDGAGDGGFANGGAISGGVGVLADARFVGNSAVGGRGGDGTGGRGGAANGGAIDGLYGSATNVLFAANLAIGGNGGTGFGSGAGGRGGDASGGAVVAGATTVASSQFLGNAALGGRGGRGGATGSGGAGGNASGGAIQINTSDGATTGLIVSDSLFSLNLALSGEGGAGVTRGAAGQGLGGAIANFSTVPVIKRRTRFFLNRASTAGNDIYGPYSG